MYRYNGTLLRNDEARDFPEIHGNRLFSQFLQEMPESPAPVLEHSRPPRDLADGELEFPRDRALRTAGMKCTDELPALGNHIELLRREDIFKEHARLLLRLHGSEEPVEIAKVFS